jgi:hypothetical protein
LAAIIAAVESFASGIAHQCLFEAHQVGAPYSRVAPYARPLHCSWHDRTRIMLTTIFQ